MEIPLIGWYFIFAIIAYLGLVIGTLWWMCKDQKLRIR